MNPLFRLGEPVILQSKTYPDLNGECRVTKVKGPKKWDCGRYGFGYRTTIKSPDGSWAESALKKKHTPGDGSFESIMSKYKVEEGV